MSNPTVFKKHPMKVIDLIRFLQQIDPDANVFIDCDGDFCSRLDWYDTTYSPYTPEGWVTLS